MHDALDNKKEEYECTKKAAQLYNAQDVKRWMHNKNGAHK